MRLFWTKKIEKNFVILSEAKKLLNPHIAAKYD